jgi:hypothetical protein
VVLVRVDLCTFPIDQKIEQVRFDGGIHHDKILAVVELVEHGHLERGRFGDRRLAGLEIDLNAEVA